MAFEQLAELRYGEMLLLQMPALLCATDEVEKAHRRACSDIPFETELDLNGFVRMNGKTEKTGVAF